MAHIVCVCTHDKAYVCTASNGGSLDIISVGGEWEKKHFQFPQPITALSEIQGYLVSGGYDNNVSVWNVDDCYLMYSLTGHLLNITCFCGLCDVLISGSSDGTLRTWRLDQIRLAVSKLPKGESKEQKPSATGIHWSCPQERRQSLATRVLNPHAALRPTHGRCHGTC